VLEGVAVVDPSDVVKTCGSCNNIGWLQREGVATRLEVLHLHNLLEVYSHNFPQVITKRETFPKYTRIKIKMT